LQHGLFSSLFRAFNHFYVCRRLFHS
jgi:hypothetical protein